MALDPEFIRKVQERKARREALEKKIPAPKKSAKGKGGGGSRKTGPIYRSVSYLTGEETYITGEDAKKREKDGTYNG